jgi:hypothetical protein
MMSIRRPTSATNWNFYCARAVKSEVRRMRVRRIGNIFDI